MAPRPPVLRRLHPTPQDETTIAEAYAVDRPVHPDRPWVGLCMVSSLDGSVAVEGSSSGLGNANDIDVLVTLRSLSEVVIVGAGTARREGYGPSKVPGLRIGVVTNRGGIDPDHELFRSGCGFVIAPHSAEIDESRVEVLRVGETTVDFDAAFRRLHEVRPGVRFVQTEGGPTLNAALLEADLIDELNLTLSSRLTGGPGARLVTGAAEIDRRYDLAHLLLDDDGFVFSRWVRRR